MARATRPRAAGSANLAFKFLAHAEYPYPKEVRQAVLEAMNATQASVANLARLNFLLAELYAEAVLTTQRRFRLKAELIGCHGQTLYHQGEPARFLGRKLAVTWQTGEGAVIAARVGVPVVSDFRPADMAAGGKGAPLVPFLDYLLYRDQTGRSHRAEHRRHRKSDGHSRQEHPPKQVAAFDTGPGNMVIDARHRSTLRRAVRSRRPDRCLGHGARAGCRRRPAPAILSPQAAQDRGPRRVWTRVRAAISRNVVDGRSKADVVATATALTARSIADALEPLRATAARKLSTSSSFPAAAPTIRPCWPCWPMNFGRCGLTIRASDEFGLPSEAKEAAAFALMAYETWNRRPSNIPSATGAKRPAILGKISYA